MREGGAVRAVPSLPLVSCLAKFSVPARLPQCWIRWWVVLNLGCIDLGNPRAETRERTAGGRAGGKTETPREDSMETLKRERRGRLGTRCPGSGHAFCPRRCHRLPLPHLLTDVGSSFRSNSRRHDQSSMTEKLYMGLDRRATRLRRNIQSADGVAASVTPHFATSWTAPYP